MFKIRLVVFDENTGYGNASSSLIKNLQKRADLELDVIRIRSGEQDNGGQHLTDLQHHLDPVDHLIIHTVPEYFPYWFNRERGISVATRIWGYTTWETTQLPTHWPALINMLDGVFVPCQWNKEIFESSGVKIPIQLLPHISEYEEYTKPEILRRVPAQLNPEHFVFYSIGVWNERKNTPALVRAFIKAFAPSEPVSLVIKSGSQDWSNYRRRLRLFMRRSMGSSAEAMHKLRKKNPDANIYHIPEQLSTEEIWQLHQTGDCFISLTRGEGWGMGTYEAARFGKPVATTKFGGQLDYLPEGDTYWLNHRLVPVKTAYGSASYGAKQRWADVDEPAAQKVMRHIFENQQEAMSKGKNLQAYIARHFNADAIISSLISILYG